MRRSFFFPSMLAAFSVVACGGSEPKPAAPPPAAVASAAPAPVASAPVDPLRGMPPKAGPARPFTPPTVVEKKLANGLRVLVVERHDLPLAALRLVFDRGTLSAAPGVAAFSAELLRGGTKTKDSLALENAWGDLGTDVSTSASDEGITLATTGPADKLVKMLELSAEMITAPAVPAAELETVRKKAQSFLAAERTDPERLLALTARQTLFGADTPAGASHFGTEATVKAMGRTDVQAFLAANLKPTRATLVVVGDAKADAVAQAAEKAFGGWKGEAPKNAAVAAVDAGPKAARFLLLDRPGATQSLVSAIDVAPLRSSPDYYATRVLGMVLGGQFSSRLNLNLREKHAYTYGARARFDMGRDSGTFGAGGAIVKDKTASAIREIFAEIERMRSEPVSDAELALAKTAIVQPFAANFETYERTAAVLADQAILGLPVTELESFPQRIEAVTKDDVLRAAKAHLRPQQMRIVVIGDGPLVKDSLEALKQGVVETRSAKAGR